MSTFKFIRAVGVKSSTKFNQSTTSSGIGAIDNLLGGGFPIGSICLYEEDNFGVHAKYFSDCFAAEGVVCGHSIFAAVNCSSIDQFYQSLPAPLSSSSTADPHPENVDDGGDILQSDTAIAWRYKNLPSVDSSVDSAGVHGQSRYFSKKKSIDEELIRKCQVDGHVLSCDERNQEMVVRKLSQILMSSDHHPQLPSGDSKNVLRILLRHFASPLWGDENEEKMFRFLYKLKCLIRNRIAVVVITVPVDLLKSSTIDRIRHYCDSVFQLKSLDDSMKNSSLYQDYKGLLRIVKLPTLNSLNFLVPDCLDLALKFKRDKLLIQKLHTPPDLSETSESASQHSSNVGGGSCATNLQRAKLDF